MLIVSIFGVVVLVAVMWFTLDYRKWLKVEYVRNAIKMNYVLPTLMYKKSKYKVIGVEPDGTFLAESIDTEHLVRLHFRKVKFLWK